MLPRMNEAGPGDARAATQADDDMTLPVERVQPGGVAVTDRPPTDAALPRGCPYLQAETGGWRLDTPTRDHRCGAFSPPASLSPEKQSRLCLTADHTTCATYLASLAAREARLGNVPADRTTRWGLARTTTVIEDAGGIRGRLLALVLDRRRWPAIPAVLLVTTLFVLALSGFRAGIPSTPIATSSPGPGAVASDRPASFAPSQPPAATAAPTEQPASASPTEAPTAEPTEGPTAAPVTPEPAASFRSYVVKSGDTLSAIAADFGVSVGAIVQLNNIEDPARLQIGQVLLIP